MSFFKLSLLIITFLTSSFYFAASGKDPDPHSYARPHEAIVRHIDLDLSVDFSNRELAGKAVLTFENITGTGALFLDTKDLIIERVTLGGDEEPAVFQLGKQDPFLGTELKVSIRPGIGKVTVYYRTGGNASGLQWLDKSQTAGQIKPYLFTQGATVHARTWIPCQDTPEVRVTYSAHIKTDPGFLAVMSAENPVTTSETGTYDFQMPQPIPSYLIALAVGDIKFQAIGPRTGIYAEPSILAAAASEFNDLEEIMKVAENHFGPYRWGRYDVLVLPPSFPYGGMENPRLTFASPALITGDRALVSTIVHELGHSWSGNLVTNERWHDFWLNEGFTVYFERRLLEILYGKETAEIKNVVADSTLKSTMAGLPSRDTHLRLKLEGRHPDEAITRVAYEKGYLFLRTIEEMVGREKFDAFLKQYFDRHAFQSISTDGFLTYLREHLLSQDPSWEPRLRIDEWIDGPGLPLNSPPIVSKMMIEARQAAQSWLADGSLPDAQATSHWNGQTYICFLRALPAQLSHEQLEQLDRRFGFTRSRNAELRMDWFLKTIPAAYEPARTALVHHLQTVGRNAWIKPLYAALNSTPEGKRFAKHTYFQVRRKSHPITVTMLDKLLSVTECEKTVLRIREK